MMSSHGANPIFFNKKNKDCVSWTFATPHPLHPITSYFCLIPLPHPQSGRHMRIISKIIDQEQKPKKIKASNIDHKFPKNFKMNAQILMFP